MHGLGAKDSKLGPKDSVRNEGMCRCFYTRPVNSRIIGGSNRAKQLFLQVKIDRLNDQLLRGMFGEVLRERLADD